MWTCLSYYLLCTTMTLEGITFRVAGSFGVGAVYLNRRGGTFAVIVIGTVVSFAVDLDFFTSVAVCKVVCHRAAAAFLETSTACLVCVCGIFTCYINLAF